MDSLTSWTLLAALVAAGYLISKSSETPPKEGDKVSSSKTAIAVESDRKKKAKKKAKKDKKEEESVPVPIAEKKKDIPKEKPTQDSSKKPQKKAPVPMVNHALVNESSEEEEEPEAPRVLVLTKPKDPTARDSEWIQAGKKKPSGKSNSANAYSTGPSPVYSATSSQDLTKKQRQNQKKKEQAKLAKMEEQKVQEARLAAYRKNQEKLWLKEQVDKDKERQRREAAIKNQTSLPRPAAAPQTEDSTWYSSKGKPLWED